MKKEKITLISKETVKKSFKVNSFVASIAMWIMRVPKLNRFYRSLLPVRNHVELFKKALAKRKISIEIDKSFKDKLPDGPFIALANHVYGFIDGMILVALIRDKYPGFKITANFLIAQLEPLKDVFIPVNPMEGKDYTPMGGSKEAIKIIEEGQPVGFFPSGGVASYYGKSKEVTDKPWMLSVFNIIDKTRVPVLPIYFHGTNSHLFHLLGKIHPYWRTFRLIKEFFKKKNTTIKIEVGDLVQPEEYKEITRLEELRVFFRKKVFNLKLKKNINVGNVQH